MPLVEPAIAAGFTLGAAPPMSEAHWAALVRERLPHLTDTRLRQVTWPDLDKHLEYIAEMLPPGQSRQHEPAAQPSAQNSASPAYNRIQQAPTTSK